LQYLIKKGFLKIGFETFFSLKPA